MHPITGPKQTVIISARGKTRIFGKIVEKDNIMALDWHMLTSSDPPMYAVSMHKDRHTLELIRESGVFCVNFLSHDMKEIALKCGSSTGKHADKFNDHNIRKDECHSIDCPKISDAAAHVECEMMSEHETGNHVIITGKILRAEKNHNSSRLFNKGSASRGHDFFPV
jgi:flavin reductase (DIM6/NTAB) family NADH-FMN oxidoreductase RutF